MFASTSIRRGARRLLVLVPCAAAALALTGPSRAAKHAPASVGPLLWQNSMNVFRRFSAGNGDKELEFYGDVLGLKKLQTFNVGGGTRVARFQIGTQQVKFTQRVPDRHYVAGGPSAATGLRLLTFFFPDEKTLQERFRKHGYPVPTFRAVPGSTRTVAIVDDPDGQAVELIVAPGAPEETYSRLEVGLTVSNLDASRKFYGGFVGLQALPPVFDRVLDTNRYPFRHGSTTINLSSFGAKLPADTGSGGIQYVVSNVDRVNALAMARHVTVEQPLSTLRGFSLRTVWLDDPDGITNYFAETAASRRARAVKP